MKILIVDDETLILELLKIMLSDYNVIGAVNGREAVEKYKESKPDIVFMDIMMPVMDGIEATKEILKIDSEAKVIAVTAYAKTKGKEMLEAGALDIIEKPFDPEDVKNIIKSNLG